MATLRWALRAYRGSALLLIATAAAGLTVVVSALMIGRNTLRLAPLPTPETGLTFSKLAAAPADIQSYALDKLSVVLLVLAVGGALVCVLTLVTVCVSRASARGAEFYLRRAVGASRRQLLSGGLLEGGVLALAAATLGAAASLIAIRTAIAAWPGTTAVPASSPAVLAVVAGIVGSAILILGVTLPTLTRERMRAPAPPSGVPPSLTVAGVQLAISFAVLFAATEIGNHARVLIGDATVAVGRGGEVLQLDTSGTPAERARHLSDLIRASGLEGVLEVTSITSPGALEGLGTVDVAITDCGRCSLGGIATPQRPVAVAFSAVSPDTFRALNVPVIEGRSIDAGDDWTARRKVVVNHALASAHFENGRAVGRRIQIGQGPNNWFEVVGVVEDTQPIALGGGLQPPYAAYASVLQIPPSSVDLLVRPRAGATLSESWLRAAVKRIGTVRRVVAENAWWAEQAAPLRWFANALWIGGALILVLAVFGTGAAMHLWVAALMPELAVRRAVGARRRDVLVYVLARAAVVGVAGVALGFVLNDLIPGASRLDVASARLALVLLTATLVGAWIPAWRAARAQPAT
jgi:hypothetical protein